MKHVYNITSTIYLNAEEEKRITKKQLENIIDSIGLTKSNQNDNRNIKFDLMPVSLIRDTEISLLEYYEIKQKIRSKYIKKYGTSNAIIKLEKI